jgi:hypothetical protein
MAERRVLITGSSGLIGSALIPFLESHGYEVTRLVRSRDKTVPNRIYWNPEYDEIDSARCEGFDAVVHLAGKNLSHGRLTGKRKQRALDSRVRGTTLLSGTLANLQRKPRVLISASGIGFYGERGDETLTEASTKGRGFLSDLCSDWEQSTAPAAEAGIRVVMLRTAVVMARSGDPLKTQSLLFRLGLGGPLGNGKSWFSWIALTDHLRAIHHVIGTESLSGPVNSTSPQPVRQKEFAKTLGQVLSRPALIPVPGFALKLRFGNDLGEAALWSQRVLPEKLTRTGFRFELPDLEAALRHELGI